MGESKTSSSWTLELRELGCILLYDTACGPDITMSHSQVDSRVSSKAWDHVIAKTFMVLPSPLQLLVSLNTWRDLSLWERASACKKEGNIRRQMRPWETFPWETSFQTLENPCHEHEGIAYPPVTTKERLDNLQSFGTHATWIYDPMDTLRVFWCFQRQQ